MKLAELPVRSVMPCAIADAREAEKMTAANRERAKQRMKQLHADPAFERRRIAALRKSFKVRRERSL